MNALDSIDDAVSESQMRKMGNIDEEMKEMRDAMTAFGLKSSHLLQLIDLSDVEGIRGLLRAKTVEDHSEDVVSEIELNKGILTFAEKFKSCVNRNIECTSVYQSLIETM